jgi:hypothetical protein
MTCGFGQIAAQPGIPIGCTGRDAADCAAGKAAAVESEPPKQAAFGYLDCHAGQLPEGAWIGDPAEHAIGKPVNGATDPLVEVLTTMRCHLSEHDKRGQREIMIVQCLALACRLLP